MVNGKYADETSFLITIFPLKEVFLLSPDTSYTLQKRWIDKLESHSITITLAQSVWSVHSDNATGNVQLFPVDESWPLINVRAVLRDWNSYSFGLLEITIILCDMAAFLLALLTISVFNNDWNKPSMEFISDEGDIFSLCIKNNLVETRRKSPGLRNRGSSISQVSRLTKMLKLHFRLDFCGGQISAIREED